MQHMIRRSHTCFELCFGKKMPRFRAAWGHSLSAIVLLSSSFSFWKFLPAISYIKKTNFHCLMWWNSPCPVETYCDTLSQRAPRPQGELNLRGSIGSQDLLDICARMTRIRRRGARGGGLKGVTVSVVTYCTGHCGAVPSCLHYVHHSAHRGHVRILFFHHSNWAPWANGTLATADIT